MELAGQTSPAFLLYHVMWCALDWIFPPSCGGCSQPGYRWCAACQQQIVRVAEPICSRCGDPLKPYQVRGETTEPLCMDCQANPPSYQALRSYGIFAGPLRDALHRLKYQRDIGMGEALSKHIIELYNDLKWDIDLITPVPLSQKRARERGYNQTALLARPLAYALRKPYLPEIMHRSRETRSQVGLTAIERHENVKDAFTADYNQVNGKAVLVIDDVMTTGSTISACAQALRTAGASVVYALTLARAQSKADLDDHLISSDKNGGKHGS